DLEGIDVKAGVGLVEDRAPGLEHQELQDLGALLLTAREALVQVALEDRLVPVEVLNGVLQLQVELHHADLVALFAPRVERETQEVGDGDTGYLDRVLEGQVESLAGAFVRFQLEDGLALQDDVAAGDLVLRVARDDLRERRLAGAVRAHEGVDLAARHHQVHPLEDLIAAFDAGVKVTYLKPLVVHVAAPRLGCTGPGPPLGAVTRTRSDYTIACHQSRALSSE